MTVQDNDIKSALEAESLTHGAEKAVFQTKRVAAFAAGHALHDTYTAFLPPLLPIFIERLALSKTEAGLLSVFTQAPSLIQPVIGHLGDRINLHFVAFTAPAVTAALMSILTILPDYWMLAACLILVGLVSAAFHAVVPVMAGQVSGRNLGRGMSFWMVGGELGRALGPVVIVTALRFMEVHSVPWLMIGGSVFAVILWFHRRDVPLHGPDTRHPQHWKNAVKQMAPVMIPLMGIIILRSFLYSALAVYLPVFLTDEGANIWLAGVSLTVLEIAGICGALLGGSLSDRFGRRRMLIISLSLSPLFTLAFLSVEGWLQFPMLLCIGFTLFSTTPVVMALVQESFPQNRALANGIYMALSFVIRSIAITGIGLFGDTVGLRQAYFYSALIMLLAVPLTFLLPQKNGSPGKKKI
jgi:FSR family fosmidomycin resistance protein-like MFS transporter